MRKEDYMARKARMDFIRYAMIQTPRLSEAEVSAKLKASIGVDEIRMKLEEMIDRTVARHLNKERLRDEEGNRVTELPYWLRPELADVIVEEYRDLMWNEIADRWNPTRVTDEVERLTWAQGVEDMTKNLRRFLAETDAEATAYAESPMKRRENFDVDAKYEAAKRVTLRERITNDNDRDVDEFREEMEKYSKALCENQMHEQMGRILREVSMSSELRHLVSWYEIAAREAKVEIKRLDEMERDEEWDAEYDARVPLEFFSRHVDEVDKGMAFRMMFLVAMARHEDYLADENFVRRNGELRIFTSPHFLSSRWGSIDFTIVMK